VRRRWKIILPTALLLGLGGSALIVFALTRYVPPQAADRTPLGRVAPVADDLSWTHTGGDAGQTRYSALAQITQSNVAHLRQAWVYHTGELQRYGELAQRSKFQATPILANGNLVLCTPFNRVIALDPATGKERWAFDARIRTDQGRRYAYACRGVAQWHDLSAASDQACAHRIFTGTNDRRVIAIDAITGAACAGFGVAGEVRIEPDRPLELEVEMQIVSAPAVAGDVVIVGTAMGDNVRAAAPSGTVFAFDARTGERLWTFDPIPRRYDPVASPTWEGDSAARTGQANVWSSITVDEQRDLVFLPTSSPSPDYYGGLRPGANLYADSIVAVRGRSGEIVWQFQTVHHNLWDYDVPAGPSLLRIQRDGRDIDALIVATKPGFLFVLDRETGQPLFPIEEHPAPQTDIQGERTSATQPRSIALPALAPQRITPDDAYGVLIFDRLACRRLIAEARNDGLFTPPSLQGSIMFPSPAGGANWGGVAVDPTSNRIVVNTNRLVGRIALIPAAQVEPTRDAHPEAIAISQQQGAPYGARFDILKSPLGMPCNPPPWGALSAIDLERGAMAWDVTLGTTKEMAPLGIALRTGTPNFGGPIITSGGVVFIGAAADNLLRAFDLHSGKELWAGALPAGGQATPMTYAIGGRQYVVIAAGGHSVLGTTIGDAVVAFALPLQ
jgi:quinoprotein glucose dehydrogenase